MKLKDEFITYETDGEQIMVAAGTDSFSGLVRSNETAGFIVECLKKTVTEDDIVHAMTDAYDAPEGCEGNIEEAGFHWCDRILRSRNSKKRENENGETGI